jgi:hypothetical protein
MFGFAIFSFMRVNSFDDEEAFGYLKRVIVTPAIDPRFNESELQPNNRMNRIKSHLIALIALNRI